MMFRSKKRIGYLEYKKCHGKCAVVESANNINARIEQLIKKNVHH